MPTQKKERSAQRSKIVWSLAKKIGNYLVMVVWWVSVGGGVEVVGTVELATT